MIPVFQQQILDILKNQQRILDKLVANHFGQRDASSSSQQAIPAPETSQESIIESFSNGIVEFIFDPENGATFDAWFSQYEDLFNEDAKNLDDAAKVTLLLRNIDTVAHQRYINYLLPVTPKEQTFKKTVETLKSIFGEQTSLITASKKEKGKKQQKSRTRTQGVFTINQVGLASRRKFFTVGINEVATQLQLDCASGTIPEVVYIQLGSPPGRAPSINAVNASGEEVRLARELVCSVSLNGTSKTGRCFVTSVPDLRLFGIEWIELFNLWNISINAVCNGVQLQSYPRTEGLIQKLQKKFQCIFSDQLGLDEKKQVQLTVKPGIKLIFRQKRSIPYAFTKKIEAELDHLQKLGIIKPVSYAEWVAPVVAAAEPNGRVRICADYCNLSNAYLQSSAEGQISASSRKLLPIKTHKGLFEVTRLSPGLKTAPEAFQEIVDNMIAGLESTSKYLDDLIVASYSVEEHIKYLECLFARISEFGFTLKIEKSHFFMGEIKYLGFIIKHQGLRPDPEKARVICEMPAPHGVTTLCSFRRAVNHSKFVRGMLELRQSMDALLKKDVTWNSASSRYSSLESNLLLKHYDPRLKIIVTVNAILMQRFPDGSSIKAVSHSSRTLTRTEKGYSQPFNDTRSTRTSRSIAPSGGGPRCTGDDVIK